jgi:capsular exopolysaccharide synthesis family protein
MQEPSPHLIELPSIAALPDFRHARPNPFSPDEDLGLWQYWTTVTRHFRLILALIVATELLTMLALLTTTRLYTATSKIMIEAQTGELLEKNQQPELDVDNFYKTQYEVLKSRSLAAMVINKLGLAKDPNFVKVRHGRRSLWSWIRSPFSSAEPKMVFSRIEILGVKPQLINAYLAGLTIRPENDTRLVDVSYSSPDAVLASRITNAHVRAFVSQTYQLHAQNTETAQHFLESKLDELEKRIESSEGALNDYRRQRGIWASSLNDKDKMMGDRIENLNRALVQAEESRIGLQADVQTIKTNDYDSLPAVVNNLLIQNLKIQLSRLEGQYANLASQATPDYPPVAQLHAQVLKVQGRLQKETSRIVESSRSRYRQALEKENELRSDLEREKTQAMSLKDASLRDAVLAREVATNRALYRSVLERIKALGMSGEAQITNISVVDTAETPLTPSSPKTALFLVMGGLLGLMLGIAAGLVVDGMDRSLKSAEDVQSYLQLPTLATVLRLSFPNEKRLPNRGRYHGERFPVTDQRNGAKALTNGANALVPAPKLFVAASEAYRAIRTAILFSRSEAPPKTILFSSAVAGEGKSVTAVNTAIAFAHMLDRILLIDADLRRPSCHELLHQIQHPGLAQVLVGLATLDEAIQPTGVKGLYLLSAGLTPPNPSELLSSKRMREVLASLEAAYDYVLIDSAPILPVSDSVVLSRMADGVVIISGARTPKEAVRDACARVMYIGAKIVGIVLNEASPELQRYYYHTALAGGEFGGHSA